MRVWITSGAYKIKQKEAMDAKKQNLQSRRERDGQAGHGEGQGRCGQTSGSQLVERMSSEEAGPGNGYGESGRKAEGYVNERRSKRRNKAK
jgi:hypothetical protein